MKITRTIAVCVAAILLTSCNDNSHKTNDMEKDTTIFGFGDAVTANFTGDAWVKMLSAVENYDCNVYNVTFAPGTRNHWHSHAVGLILLCTDGEGWYQEKGKAARRLRPGDVVNIPAGTMHWHGATIDKRFTHIGITPKASANSADWGDPVTDREYEQVNRVE